MYPVQLAGQRVTLREFRPDDLDATHRIVGDPRVTAFLSFPARDRQASAGMLDGILARARAEPRTELYLAVTPRAHDQLVGFVRLGLDGVQAAKLGCAIAADHWRRGYARDAVRAVLDFGFGTMELHRISAAIGPTNTASICLIESFGFTHEGRIRDHVGSGAGWRDSELYSMLAPEWSTSAHAPAT